MFSFHGVSISCPVRGIFLKGNTMINFSSKNDGTWFYFDPMDKSQGGICLRVLSSDESNRIESLTVKHSWKVKRGTAYDEPKEDKELAAKLRWDYCIVDWKGVSLDGVELSCTSDNKEKLVKVSDFISFLIDCMESLNEKSTVIEEARLKNLRTMQDSISKDVTVNPV